MMSLLCFSFLEKGNFVYFFPGHLMGLLENFIIPFKRDIVILLLQPLPFLPNMY